jgi:hypothetical protein
MRTGLMAFWIDGLLPMALEGVPVVPSICGINGMARFSPSWPERSLQAAEASKSWSRRGTAINCNVGGSRQPKGCATPGTGFARTYKSINPPIHKSSNPAAYV